MGEINNIGCIFCTGTGASTCTWTGQSCNVEARPLEGRRWANAPCGCGALAGCLSLRWKGAVPAVLPGTGKSALNQINHCVYYRPFACKSGMLHEHDCTQSRKSLFTPSIPGKGRGKNLQKKRARDGATCHHVVTSMILPRGDIHDPIPSSSNPPISITTQ